MASSKDHPATRPVSGSFSRHPSNSRPHSHSVSLSATNPSHRIHRRKSVNAQASSTAQAAIAAALREQGETSGVSLPTHRKSIGSKKSSESQSMNARPSMHSYFGDNNSSTNLQDQEAVEDISPDEDAVDSSKNKNRDRRASEGSHLVKEGKKSGGELRCDTCGKGYKHSSCLTKHKWEHNPAWAYTSKLLISKHQQVQLLEAASVLCTMNNDSTIMQSDLEMPHRDPSEASSASPGFSGSSEIQDELSSVETTPPPTSEGGYPVPDFKRYSASSTGFSRSYRSIPSSSFAESVFSPGLPPHRLSGVDLRPGTSGTDDGGLSAAAAGLSFSSGTPRTRPSLAHSDIPPVPPLPQQYQSFNSKSSDSTLTNVYNFSNLHPPALTQQLSDERESREGKGNRSSDPFISNERDIEEEGIFKMEE